mgnify:CR=1 FL=1
MMPTLIQNIACHFLMGFLIESHLIMHVAGSQQNFPQIRNILGMHLFIQPLDIFAGMLQIFLYNMSVYNHVCHKKSCSGTRDISLGVTGRLSDFGRKLIRPLGSSMIVCRSDKLK